MIPNKEKLELYLSDPIRYRDELRIMSDKLIFIQSDDKPIKITFENDTPLEPTYGTLPETEVAQRIIRDMKFNGVMKTIVYRTLKGQLKHGNLNDVINFIRKNGYGERFDKYDRTTMTYTIRKKVDVPKGFEVWYY